MYRVTTLTTVLLLTAPLAWAQTTRYSEVVEGNSSVAPVGSKHFVVSAQGELPELSFTEANLDFGTVAVGSPGGPILMVVLTNESETATATGLSFETDEAFPRPHPTVRPIGPPPPNAGTCWDGLGWINLSPGESCFFSLKFVPSVAGSISGTLTATSAEGAEATMTHTGVGGEDVMLYGQPRDWETMPFFTGKINASFIETPEYNSELADDFLVTDSDGWIINKIGLEILAPPQPVLSIGPGEIPDIPVDVHFMPDDDGVPGNDPVCSAEESQYEYWEPPHVENRVEVLLSEPCTLPPGHYWLRVDMTSNNYNFGWVAWDLQFVANPEDPVPPVNLNHPVWRNSGGGFGLCLDWTPVINCDVEFPIYGTVFWLIGQEGQIIADEASPEALADALSTPSPNPTGGTSTFTIAVERGQNVSVEVFDVMGRHVQTVYQGTLPGGMSERLTLDASTLPAGVYIIRATGENFAETRRVTIVR